MPGASIRTTTVTVAVDRRQRSRHEREHELPRVDLDGRGGPGARRRRGWQGAGRSRRQRQRGCLRGGRHGAGEAGGGCGYGPRHWTRGRCLLGPALGGAGAGLPCSLSLLGPKPLHRQPHLPVGRMLRALCVALGHPEEVRHEHRRQPVRVAVGHVQRAPEGMAVGEHAGASQAVPAGHDAAPAGLVQAGGGGGQHAEGAAPMGHAQPSVDLSRGERRGGRCRGTRRTAGRRGRGPCAEVAGAGRGVWAASNRVPSSTGHSLSGARPARSTSESAEPGRGRRAGRTKERRPGEEPSRRACAFHTPHRAWTQERRVVASP